MSCLFNTLSRFIDIDSPSLRHNICNYLQNNPKLYDDIKAEDAIMWSNEGYQNIHDYISAMRSSSTWGGAIEIKCFCNMYNMKVVVHGQRNTIKNEVVEFLPEITTTTTEIHINWNGGHYYV